MNWSIKTNGKTRQGLKLGRGTRRTFCVCSEGKDRLQDTGTWEGPRELPGWSRHSTRVPCVGTNNPAAAETDWDSIFHSFYGIFLCVTGP